MTLGSLTQTYTGGQLAASATTDASYSVSVDFTYNGSSIAPTNAGSYAVIGTINDPNYQGSSAGTFTINKANASITLSDLSQTYSGFPRGATAVTSPLDLTVDLLYDGSPTEPINAGTYAVTATIDDINYVGTAFSVFTINPATALITITNTTQNFDGSPKPVTVTTTPLSVPISITYDNSATVPAAAGSYNVSVVVTDLTI